MNYRDITIQTHAHDQSQTPEHAFKCQLLEIDNTRTYLLSETKTELEQQCIQLVSGYRIVDNGILYRIKKVWYLPSLTYPFIAVYRDCPV